jgi:hypothetical protein
VVDELRARDRGRHGQFRIGIDRASPRGQYRFATMREMRRQLLEPAGGMFDGVHVGCPLPRLDCKA